MAIYARFSHEGQKETSIDRQVEGARTQIQMRGFVEGAVYADRGKSGLSMKGRLELHRALADAKLGAFDILMVEHADRIARTEADAFHIRDVLEALRIRIFDRQGELRDLNFAVKAVMAADEVRRLKERVARGRASMVEQGRSPHKIRFGYRRVKKGVYEPHPEREGAVREIFARYAGGVSRARIARDLTERFPTPGDAQLIDSGKAPTMRRSKWTVGMVREVIKGRLYVGWVYDGVTEVYYDSERQRRVRLAEKGDPRRGEAPWARIVDERLWVRANLRLQQERAIALPSALQPGAEPGPRTGAGSTTASFLLRGLVACGHCGGTALFGSRRHREWAVVECGCVA